MEIKELQVAILEPNKGQINGLPKNPRFIKDDRFLLLKKSIEADPEMMALRECLVYPIFGAEGAEQKYVIIAGNMRFRACKDLGYVTVPCKVIPAETPVEKLRAYAIKDNIAYGDDDFDLLANEWDSNELADWGLGAGNWGVEPTAQASAPDNREHDGSIHDISANSYLNGTIRQIVLYYDPDGHKDVLERLERIGLDYDIKDDNSEIVLALIQFYEDTNREQNADDSADEQTEQTTGSDEYGDTE